MRRPQHENRDSRRVSIPAIVEERRDTKAQLQRRMEEARESISQTVDEIKDTVEDQYATVKATVTGILDWREQFQNEPIVWSVGALSAGFALGYTVGVAQRKQKRPGRKRSEVGAFADTLVDQLATIAKALPLPEFDPKLKQLLGFDLSDLLAEIGGVKSKRTTKRSSAKSVGRRKHAPHARRKRSGATRG